MLFYCVSVGALLVRIDEQKTHDELLNEYSLSDTGTAEKTNLSTTSVGSKQVDDLDAGNQHLGGGRLLGESRRVGVDGRLLDSLDRATLVNGVASDVDDTAESARADGDGDGVASVGRGLATAETRGAWCI